MPVIGYKENKDDDIMMMHGSENIKAYAYITLLQD
jgi:hypothetical protein